MIVALAASAGRKIEFERDRRPHGGDGGFDRGLGNQSAAEIGVQHRAGQIEHGTQIGSRIDRELGERSAGDGVRRLGSALPARSAARAASSV